MKNISLLGFIAIIIFFVGTVSQMGIVDAKICNKIIHGDCHFCYDVCRKQFGSSAGPRCEDNDQCNCSYRC
ncbi:hypothetical protein SAY87_002317 [Trapa incisa]|uniref:Defensin-like protein n=1 Tax=Trapa incisa TaxID=236973 RepID=A0AAN7JTW3_9MYRT|nr:hypothetical protein SAY87_002317 [Trapa incisa]